MKIDETKAKTVTKYSNKTGTIFVHKMIKKLRIKTTKNGSIVKLNCIELVYLIYVFSEIYLYYIDKQLKKKQTNN